MPVNGMGMASNKPQVNRAITKAVNEHPPRNSKITGRQKVERERAVTEYLRQLSEGERETRVLLHGERYHG